MLSNYLNALLQLMLQPQQLRLIPLKRKIPYIRSPRTRTRRLQLRRPFELFHPTCCKTLGIKAHRISPFAFANSSVSISTYPIRFVSYRCIRSEMRDCGNTRPCEQQPNLGISCTPGAMGSVETRPAAKKWAIRRVVQTRQRRMIRSVGRIERVFGR